MIDWGKAPEGYDWHAFEVNGNGYWYTAKPRMVDCGWKVRRRGDMVMRSPHSAQNPNLGWSISLKQRPQPTSEFRSGAEFKLPKSNGCHIIGSKHPHYHKNVSRLDSIDIYQVFRLWGTTDHEIEHAIKKLLNAGQRGAKTKRQDVQEAIDTLNRYLEITEGDQ